MQRQSTPPIASATSVSLGEEFFSSSAVAATNIPGVQAPHWAAPCRRNDCCSLPCSGARPANPSTVVISHPATCPVATRQEHTGSPSIKTVQAPQSPASHPTFVPVRPRSSRSTRESRLAPCTATSTARPFTENETKSVPAAITFSVVAMSACSHAGFQRSLHQSQGSIPTVIGRCPHIIDGGKRRQVFRPNGRANSRTRG